MQPTTAIATIAGMFAVTVLLSACGTPTSPTAQPPHALTSLSSGWQVGASEMRDGEGRSFTVCTLQRAGDGGSRFWIATTSAAITRDLYIGLRSAALPAVEGRVPRKAGLVIDGTAFRPQRAQQAGDSLSMVLPGAESDAFLQAFAKGYNLEVKAEDLPGFSFPVNLVGTANGRREWQKCIETELKPPANG